MPKRIEDCSDGPSPARADAFVRQAVDVLEQQQPDHEAGLDAGPAILAVERRNLAVDPAPVDLAGKLHQLMFHVDDLIEPGPEQIVRLRPLALLGSHSNLRSSANHRLCWGSTAKN